MSSNIGEFFKTRKFWSPVIALVMTLITHFVPKYLGIDISTEMLNTITVFLWSIAGLVVYGDAKYDWIRAENEGITTIQLPETITGVEREAYLPGAVKTKPLPPVAPFTDKDL